ncbi:hypothetical protein F0562_020154 [Nyssa sinensis]|uniref:RWP-RK domain-containing protein n=1 Tax=Nyssa sinensis TaxID=561372 RepID=A0A5J5BTE6_9ASTE|nr:hypothetical protein F0562_020154 [Nyssa sinensis]
MVGEVYQCADGDAREGEAILYIFLAKQIQAKIGLASPDVRRRTVVGIEDKIRSALHELSLKFLDAPILIQFWAAVTNEGRCFLTTREQPFGLSHCSKKLCSYRNHSLEYKSFVDGESEEELGFPARVYRQKWPESTPNVQYYSTKQHPWCDRALGCKNLALLALPVFESSGNFCVGVLEVVGPLLDTEEVEEISTTLEAAHLKCLGRRCNHFDEKIRNEGLQHAIRELLDEVCEIHELPLAQTWVFCKDCNDGACCSSPNESPGIAFSKIGTFYGIDRDADSFFETTDVLQLQKDQWVVARAYLGSHNASFCRDITQFPITEYPMVHHARYQKFCGCFAICLNGSDTGVDKYIIEFFLPRNKRIYGHPRPQILDKILATMKQRFPNLKIASGEPVGVELFIEEVHIFQTHRALPTAEALQNGEDMYQANARVYTSYPANAWSRPCYRANAWDQQWIVRIVQDDAIDSGKNIGSAEQSDTAGRNSGKKRKRRGPEIIHEDLQNHFGRKLDDVAKSFGVSRATFKRICRENGIPQWPRRKG